MSLVNDLQFLVDAFLMVTYSILLFDFPNLIRFVFLAQKFILLNQALGYRHTNYWRFILNIIGKCVMYRVFHH